MSVELEASYDFGKTWHPVGSANGRPDAIRVRPNVLTAELVRELRERSGEGIMACKAALVAHQHDIELALEHLRCEGQAVVRRPGSLQPCGCPVK